MTKKILALTLALACASLLVSCGDDGSNSSEKSKKMNSSANDDVANESDDSSSSVTETELLSIKPDSNRLCAYRDRTAFLSDSGALYVWGDSEISGYLGLGDWDTESKVPAKLMDNVASVSFGPTSSAAITKDGALYTWGYNEYDELVTNFDSYTPVKVMDNVASVGLGAYYTAALTYDGELYTWGSNEYGKAGIGRGKESSPSPVKIMDDVAFIFVETEAGYAIKKDGTLYAWGLNKFGGLGNGEQDNFYPYPIKIMDNVVSFYSNGVGSQGNRAAITADGSLYSWGANEFAVVIPYFSDEIISKPTKVIDDVVSVDFGGSFCSALKSDGSLWTWGCNVNGRLGNGTDVNSAVPVKIMDDVVSFKMGDYFGSAIKKDGTLYMWGLGVYGELGQGHNDKNNKEKGKNATESYSPVKVLDNVEAVSFGKKHVAAMTKDGNIYTWGDNEQGQLGDGTTSDSFVPIKVNIPQ